MKGEARKATTAMVAKLHPDGCALDYASYLNTPLSSNLTNAGTAIAVDSPGDAYVGSNGSQAEIVPSVNALQPDLGAGSSVSELDPTGSHLLFSSPLGGSAVSHVNGLAIDSNNDIFVAGDTESQDFPILNALQPTCADCLPNNNVDVAGTFVAKISPGAASGVFLTRPSLTFPPLPVGVSSNVQMLGLINSQSVALNIQSVMLSGTGYTLPSSATPCSGSLAPGAGCVVAVQFDPTATGSFAGTLTITDDGPGSPRQIQLNGTGSPDFTLTANPQQTTPLAGTGSIGYIVNVQPAAGIGAPSGNVGLSCTGATPATCSFSPASAPIGSWSSTLPIAMANSMPKPVFSERPSRII